MPGTGTAGGHQTRLHVYVGEMSRQHQIGLLGLLLGGHQITAAREQWHWLQNGSDNRSISYYPGYHCIN